MFAAVLAAALFTVLPDTTLNRAEATAALLAGIKAYTAPFTPEGEALQTRIEWIDLTGDGAEDALVYVESLSWCGSGGCTLLVFEALAGEDADELGLFRPAAEISHTNGEVLVLGDASNGWRDLLVSHNDTDRRVLQFDGETYPGSPAEGIALTGGLPDGDLRFASER